MNLDTIDKQISIESKLIAVPPPPTPRGKNQMLSECPTPPAGVCTDSYKASHHLMYPPGTERIVSYSECRRPYSTLDQRIVFYGSRYYLSRYLKRWTYHDVEAAEDFFFTHNVGNTPYPFPSDLLTRVVTNYGGMLPIRVQSLREGEVFYPHVPFLQVVAEGEWARLGTFLETLLSHLWYPITVATISRHVWEIISTHFSKSVDPEDHWLLPSRLHDFGFRGCTVLEQAIIGGSAHLLSFDGTDTAAAAWYARRMDNHDSVIGTSIPATEHSVMMAWPSEPEICNFLIDRFGKTIYANVADTYNFNEFLRNVLPLLAPRLVEAGGVMVIRPDSGNPVDNTLLALQAADVNFGSIRNKLGYKVLKHSAVIYGDSMTPNSIDDILISAENHGFSAQNIAFGMGAGLLQKCDRDTLSVATKLSSITINGVEHEKMKHPIAGGKDSIPGELRVNTVNSALTTYPVGYVTPEPSRQAENCLELVYDGGWVKGNTLTTPFSEIRTHLNHRWKESPKIHDALSPEIRKKIAAFRKRR